MEDPVKMEKTVVEIEGDRKLYKYEFEIESDSKEEPKDSDKKTD